MPKIVDHDERRAHIVEAPADRLGPEALNVYLDLKRRDLL